MRTVLGLAGLCVLVGLIRFAEWVRRHWGIRAFLWAWLLVTIVYGGLMFALIFWE